MRKLTALLLIVGALYACSSSATIREELESSYDDYVHLMRWHRYDNLVLFTTQSLREAFQERVEAAKDVTVVDYRIMNVVYDEVANEATVVVEIEYYKLPSNRIKKLVDSQQWKYLDVNGKKMWRLVSLLPQF